MNQEVKEEDIKISEEKDGSVTVEVPENLVPEEEQEEPKEPQMAEGGQSDDEDQPGDSDAVREARRARRKAKKEYIKKVQTEKDQRLVAQDREISRLQERLTAMEREAQIDRVAKLEKAIEDEKNRMNWAKVRLKEATERADGSALVSAQEQYMASTRNLENLIARKSQSEQYAKERDAATDPRVQTFADRWVSKNSWYDSDGQDPKSKLAKKIDSQLAQEGWNPASQMYWNELDARLEAELQDIETDAYTDNTDETPRKRGPRSVVTGSEREIGGGASRNTFTLSADQVRAMKDAGLWDDPKKRARMIQKYAEYARQNRS